MWKGCPSNLRVIVTAGRNNGHGQGLSDETVLVCAGNCLQECKPCTAEITKRTDCDVWGFLFCFVF